MNHYFTYLLLVAVLLGVGCNKEKMYRNRLEGNWQLTALTSNGEYIIDLTSSDSSLNQDERTFYFGNCGDFFSCDASYSRTINGTTEITPFTYDFGVIDLEEMTWVFSPDDVFNWEDFPTWTDILILELTKDRFVFKYSGDNNEEMRAQMTKI